MKITIVGCGNIGTQFAVHCAGKGHEVTVFSSRPEKIRQHLVIEDREGHVLHEGNIRAAVSSPEPAFHDADLVFVTYPSFAMKKAAHLLEPYVHAGMAVCLVPGNGGGETAFAGALAKGAVLFGIQRVPSVARLVRYGEAVCATGYRSRMYAAALPKQETAACCRIIQEIFDIPCSPLPGFLNLTLTPSNPILHTTRLRTIFKGYVPGQTFYPELPLFYEDWSDETTRLLFSCDEEVQTLCRSLSPFDLSGVRSLKEHYENDTVEGFTAKIRSIEGFKGLPTPSVTTARGLIPDFSSRYFTADFNYGLQVFLKVSRLFGVPMPSCEAVYDWYRPLRDRSYGEFSYDAAGIADKAAFVAFYAQ